MTRRMTRRARPFLRVELKSPVAALAALLVVVLVSSSSARVGMATAMAGAAADGGRFAERDASPSELSRGDQGIFGSSYAEDCIFGSTASLFREPPAVDGESDRRGDSGNPSDEVVSVASVQQRSSADASEDSKLNPSKKALGFRHMPSFGRRR
jgi:hypothetical protein